MSHHSGAQLRLLTFNIRHGASAWGAGTLNIERTASVIAAQQPDVVAVQEVDRHFGARSEYQDQPALLAEMTGLPHLLYAPAITRAPEPGHSMPREYGIALLSRFPLQPVQMGDAPVGTPQGSQARDGSDQEAGMAGTSGPAAAGAYVGGTAAETAARIAAPGALALPLATTTSAEGEPRAALAARIRIPGGTDGADGTDLVVATTHLDAFVAEHRRAQAAHLARALAAQDGPAVLCGDMNTRAGAPELADLRRTGWREARAGEMSISRLLGRTFPARFPLRRIDQVRTRGAVQVTALRTIRTWASDHFALAADLRVS